MKVEKIILYPVKSMAGYEVDSAECDENGLMGDRRFVVTRPDGKFLTSRQVPAIMMLKPIWLADYSGIVIKGKSGQIKVPVPASDTNESIKVWNDSVESADCGDDVAKFLSRELGRDARLKAIGNKGRRHSENNEHAPDSYADAMPLLVMTQESIDHMNDHLDDGVTWKNFRPNVLLTGADKPFAEDFWQEINISKGRMTLEYGCARCVMTTVDPETGEFRKDKEPMRHLRTYRKESDKQIYVGQNAVSHGSITVNMGDAVTIHKTREKNVLQGE
ncbi:MOSC domain-containing protein [Pseudemcibacter aquimaris]|uniref:MOSC domain-containing protein n=1 Tax=Pseudemcibacter aquimaris TaxID=2857064 RepID=UPI0020127AB8|nr:MOSC N-terminal beta barrel domain-containing protein [Pseudemcibacter aquimaris]MCC3859883.1 MOSC N-terminal beta barrel domain-containing protein [Pseudemcibacter aquimaris]WDU57215.1 MOSC domain-containing protein [Pseudemcibacter aquimaris]